MVEAAVSLHASPSSLWSPYSLCSAVGWVAQSWAILVTELPPHCVCAGTADLVGEGCSNTGLPAFKCQCDLVKGSFQHHFKPSFLLLFFFLCLLPISLLASLPYLCFTWALLTACCLCSILHLYFSSLQPLQIYSPSPFLLFLFSHKSCFCILSF